MNFIIYYLLLGHFLLTELLVPKLADKSRVIFVSSAAHSLTKSLDLSTVFVVDEGAQGISARFQNYANSKLCLLLYSKNFAQRFKGKFLYWMLNIKFDETIFLNFRARRKCLQCRSWLGGNSDVPSFSFSDKSDFESNPETDSLYCGSQSNSRSTNYSSLCIIS
jgi:hypothetical protein